MVHHERRKRIIIVNWHSFSVEDFLELWGDDLVGAELDNLSIKSLEIYDGNSKGIC